MEQFQRKVVVITGATSGIGEATAKAFAKEGARVVLVGRSIEKGKILEKEIIQNGGKAEYYCCDVTNEEEIQGLAKMIDKNYAKVDILFNNAGIMLPSYEIEKIPEDDWKRTFEVNVDGVYLITKYLKKYIFQVKGCIINNASIAGMHQYVAGRSYAYSASKAAVIQFTRQMAKNYAEDGVRVNCICPGIIETPILGDRDRKIYEERIPLKYIGKPEEVASVVLFLASQQAGYITGAVIPIDGGVTLGG